MPERVAKSGRVLTRLPKTLHENLSELALREGVSLNTLMIALLSEGAARLQSGAKQLYAPEMVATTCSKRPTTRPDGHSAKGGGKLRT